MFFLKQHLESSGSGGDLAVIFVGVFFALLLDFFDDLILVLELEVKFAKFFLKMDSHVI